ncbi:hypothetical protein GCM10010441_76300 [Kitasatospora paracochleata]
MLGDIVAQVVQGVGLGRPRPGDDGVVRGEQRVGGGHRPDADRPVGVLGLLALGLVLVGAAAEQLDAGERAESQEGPPGGGRHGHAPWCSWGTLCPRCDEP